MEQSGNQVQQCRLTNPIRPQQCDHFATIRLEREVVEDLSLAVAECNVCGFEDRRHYANLLLRFRRYRNAGPPINAVSIPTGNSVGETAVRATVSATTRNAAPPIAASGRSRK